MESCEISGRLDYLYKDREEKLEKRLGIATEMEKLEKNVLVYGVIALGSLIVHNVLLMFLANSKNPSLNGLSDFLKPAFFVLFLFGLVMFVAKGYDLVINSRTKLGKKLAEKLKQKSMSNEIESLNTAIMFLEGEIDKLEEEKTTWVLENLENIENKAVYNETSNTINLDNETHSSDKVVNTGKTNKVVVASGEDLGAFFENLEAKRKEINVSKENKDNKENKFINNDLDYDEFQETSEEMWKREVLRGK